MATVMAVRYTPDELIHLRESPLVVKPPGLPPAEQWMGYEACIHIFTKPVLTWSRLPAESARNSTKPNVDRSRNDSNALTDQPRRPAAERHISRNSGSKLSSIYD